MSASENNDLSYNMHARAVPQPQLRAGPDIAYGLPLHVRGSGVEQRRRIGQHADARRSGGSRQRDDVAEPRLRPHVAAIERRFRRATLGYKDRYFFDGSLRKDGSSLFGEDQRYHNYYRASLAWLLTDEPWFQGKSIFDQFKFRAAVGTAGGRPSFSAQYEALTIGTGGSITANTLGNKDLRPENTLETEYGIDAELFHKYGVNITYARDITTDELLLVPASVSSGFSNQWRNAGTMDGRTWEVSLNVPVITKRSFIWTSRFNWDQNRAYITRSSTYPNTSTPTSSSRVGERYGNV